ncbi:MAG: class I SAM-dependent rRNA methyltransferase [Microscillaceae bacterium]|nr:class I SAM-dependent rRNA methyltransferase [Microscillaceae bacterium]MDW8460634.1 class I SAM-dependent rRNA methyltransferase [Cytophagales bacterium]
MIMPQLVLKAGKERALLKQHPWIFSGAIKQLPQAENGDIVQVLDNHNHLLGYGFFSPQSQITCRMIAFTRTPFQANEWQNFWQQKVEKAFQLRQRYIITSLTNAYRLLHAEGDFLPGVIVDVYNNIAVMQLLIKGTERICTQLVQAIQNIGIPYIYLKTKENSTFLENVNLPKGWLTQAPESSLVHIKEHGFEFEVDIEKGQKTGFFLDQRENRLLLQSYTQNQKVLNAFSYTGGFSVYALAGGATEVHSVDISKEATQLCEKNIQLNFAHHVPHQTFIADCFDFLRQTQEQYNVIILDPPAFAKSAKNVPNASRGYKDLNLLAFRKIAPKGIVFTFSCSGNIDRDLFRKIIFAAAADAGREIRILHQLTQPIDHPINIYHPEGEYLKGLVLYVE